MSIIRNLSLVLLLSSNGAINNVHGFSARNSRVKLPKTVAKASLSSLPVFIIGPMIRKMREEKRKKERPLVSLEEVELESPGLKIGTNVWKWPPIWPYDLNLFNRKEDGPDPMSMLNPALASLSKMASAKNEFDALKYWGEEKVDVTTDVDEEAIEKLKSHYNFYLKEGMDVLEFGAAIDSYLPSNLKFDRHVGVSLSKSLMDKNPSLTERLVVDMNNVLEEVGIDSDEIKSLGDDSFDAIIMANTIDFLTSPREVFKTAWRLLKPGGIMLVSFMNKDANTKKFGDAQTNMWGQFTDDQHMYVCGSFFQFSAGEGWDGLKGFDISPAKEDGLPIVGDLLNSKKSNNMFVVQAKKNYVKDSINLDDPEESFQSKMWMMPTLENRDKLLISPRLARTYLSCKNTEEQQQIVNHVQFLPKIYEVMTKMDQFAFSFNLQSQLATDLVSNSEFNANDEQILALKMGLGLRKPSPDFWVPVGENSANMTPEDKVNLLAYIVPRFGSHDPNQSEALDNFVTGLKPTYAVIRKKCPTLSVADVETLGTELLACEMLIPGLSTKEQFASWLGELTENELLLYLNQRKSLKETAQAEMKEMQQQRQALIEKQANLRKKMEDQVQEAAQSRTMAFNKRTGRMEEIER